jgi:hypothetical protein
MMPLDATMQDVLLALRSPAAIMGMSSGRITDLIARARIADVLGRIGARAQRDGSHAAFTDRLQGVFASAVTAAKAYQRMARFETDRLQRALKALGHDIVLLKGSAYVVADLPPADGRRLSDVDILLPRALVDAAEARLLSSGWIAAKTDEYDQRYFREWMHELPPLRHQERDTIIDMHHTILPLTGRLRPDPALLLADAIPVAGWPGVRVLAPADMVLHNVVHHFQDGEFQHSLRELVDLDDLLRHFGGTDGFWDALIERTAVLGFGRPAFYALRHAARLLETPVPAHVTAALRRYAPPAPVLALMDRAIRSCLVSTGRLPRGLRERAASKALYLRAQWLKMPPALLVRHAASKMALGIRRPSAD